MKRALIVYWSHSGSTEKVAVSIERGLTSAAVATTVMRVQEAANIDANRISGELKIRKDFWSHGCKA